MEYYNETERLSPRLSVLSSEPKKSWAFRKCTPKLHEIVFAAYTDDEERRITEARKEPNASSLRLPRARCVPPRSGRCRRWYAARVTDEAAAAAASPGATGLCRTARAGHDEFERLLARLPTPHLRDGTGAHVRARAPTRGRSRRRRSRRFRFNGSFRGTRRPSPPVRPVPRRAAAAALQPVSLEWRNKSERATKTGDPREAAACARLHATAAAAVVGVFFRALAARVTWHVRVCEPVTIWLSRR